MNLNRDPDGTYRMVISVAVKPDGPRAATVNNRWCGEGLASRARTTEGS